MNPHLLVYSLIVNYVVVGASSTVSSPIVRPLFLDAKDPGRCHLGMRINCRDLALASLNALLESIFRNVGEFGSHFITVAKVLQAANIDKYETLEEDYKCVVDHVYKVIGRVYLEVDYFNALIEFNQGLQSGLPTQAVNFESFNRFWSSQKQSRHISHKANICNPYFFYQAAIKPEMVGRPFSDIIVEGGVFHPGIKNKIKVVVPIRSVAVAIVEKVKQVLERATDNNLIQRKRGIDIATHVMQRMGNTIVHNRPDKRIATEPDEVPSDGQFKMRKLEGNQNEEPRSIVTVSELGVIDSLLEQYEDRVTSSELFYKDKLLLEGLSYFLGEDPLLHQSV